MKATHIMNKDICKQSIEGLVSFDGGLPPCSLLSEKHRGVLEE